MKTQKLLLTFITLVLLTSFTVITAQPKPAETKPEEKFKRVKGEKVPNQYIINFSATFENKKIKTTAEDLVKKHSGKLIEIFQYASKGFSVELTEASAIELSKDPSVESVSENEVVALGTRVQIINTDPDPAYRPWNLDRIDQRNLPLNNIYTYSSTGQGVNVYLLDTGVNPNHVEFEGRAEMTADCRFSPCQLNTGFDNYGHGTAAAGVIGGKTYGVAKEAKIKSVKIADCGNLSIFAGQPCTTDTLIIRRAFEWVQVNQVKPAVVNLSWTSGMQARSSIISVINSGVPVVIAAGNQNTVVPFMDGASIPEAITVGASDRNDARASFSNYGSSVDFFAPGVDIPTTLTYKYTSTNTATVLTSGTSFAAPHVAGLAAQYLQINKNAISPTIASAISNNATTNVISNPGFSTTSSLIFSDFLDVVATNAASYAFPPLAPEAISTAFGPDLANTTQSATGSYSSIAPALEGITLPTNIGGTYINVKDSQGIDRLAPLFYVSPLQVNYQIPQGTANGMAIFTVHSGSGSISEGPLNIQQVGPGLFSATADGRGVAAAYITRVHNGIQSNEPIAQYNTATGNYDYVPINLAPSTDQVYLVLFATGVRQRSSLGAVTTSFNTLNSGVVYAGAQGYFIGLDQINVLIPPTVDTGVVNVKVIVDGQASNIVKINIQ
jgi:uncharacterized protein (TIGR03437 family)